MKILVLSDSHNSIKNMDMIINKLSAHIEYILFLGDVVEDILRFVNKYSNIIFQYIRGNCDYINNVPDDLLLTIEGKKILLTHGHRYDVKSGTDRLSYFAMEKEADICLFGHTHCPTCFYVEEILMMNPGSISMPRGYPFPTYGVITIENNEIDAGIFAIEKGNIVPARNLRKY